MKIICLQAENVKKLVAVEIRPTKNMVEITGKNGQGKTSILDCILYGLTGEREIPATPIRIGTTEARIRIDMGEYVVTRKFKTVEGGDYTTSIKVETADGTRVPSPQAALDALLGALTFDPLEFSRAKPADRFKMLRQFAPEIDFEKIEAANNGDYEARTDVNRRAKEKRMVAEAIVVNPAGPIVQVDEAGLLDELQKAADHNASIETRKTKRAEAVEDVKKSRERVNALRIEADQLEAAADALEKKLKDAPALPAPVDVDAIRIRVDRVRTTNNEIADRKKRREAEAAAAALEAESEALTKAMADREAAKAEAIRNAKLPVEGISFGEGEVLLNGLPFEQAADAERLSASIEVAMALKPTLRVIRVRDGSLLDEDSMRLLAEMAEARDYQVWIERVDSSGKVGFVIEDGEVKGAPRAVAAKVGA